MNCTNYSSHAVPPGTVLYYVAHVVPVIFAAGIVGNVLNLLVLGTRQRTNMFLSCMALADLGFSFLMNWVNLAAFDGPVENNGFLAVYYTSKPTVTAMVNWFSACSTWFAVAVTVERFVAVHFPLKAPYLLNRKAVSLSIAFILLITFLCGLHSFLFSYIPIPQCRELSRPTYRLLLPGPKSAPVRYEYIRISTALSAVMCVLVPLTLLIIFNSLLISSLYTSRRALSHLGQSSRAVQERRVTVTVVVITVTALVLLTPSAGLALWDAIAYGPARIIPPWYGSFGYFCNMLVVVNRASNFLLYCLSSEAFRSKLVSVLCRRRSNGNGRKQSTMITRTTSYDAHRKDTICRQSNCSVAVNSNGETIELLTKAA